MVVACESIVRMRRLITIGSSSIRRTILCRVRNRLINLRMLLYLFTIKDETPKPKTWQVEKLILMSPDGDSIEIKSTNMFVVADMLLKMSQP